jgi:acetyl-CoA synthetase
MPLIPEAIISILACNRIGAIPCILYSGISGIALAERINDCSAKLIIAADGTFYNNDFKDLTMNVIIALERIKRNLPVVLVERARPRKLILDNLITWNKWINGKSNELQYRRMQSEYTAFMIYTSGTTGKPKLVVHTGLPKSLIKSPLPPSSRLPGSPGFRKDVTPLIHPSGGLRT